MKPSSNPIILRAGTLLIAGSLLAALAGCSDDTFNSDPLLPGKGICFSETVAADWINGSRGSSTGVATATGVSQLTSPGQPTLYLIGSQSEGIALHSDARSRASRGQALTTEGMTDFGVYASLVADDAPLYMNNVAVSKSGDYWMPEKEYLWPGDKTSLHFNAYAPYASSASDGEGITALPMTGENDAMTLSYTVPADVAAQFDLMWGTPVDASVSPCQLTFNHALTAIRFVTGAEMAACTVKEITISGVNSTGKLDIESGTWSDLGTPASYSVTPDLELSATGDAATVESGIPLTSDKQTFLLLPQVLGDNALVTLTIENGGTTTTYTASLSGQIWTAGTTVIYRLSANPSSPDLYLRVVDKNGNVVTSFDSPYTGGSHDFTVRSYYSDGKGGATIPVEWDAAFLDANGNEIERPSWIISFPSSGTDNEACTMVTDLPEPIFLATNPHTDRLRSAADINTSTGISRYNLASASGSAGVENTANSYVITAPGKYSLPLVYGNAIKNGITNSAAYTSTITQSTTHDHTTLYRFINHLGNDVTDPYIYNNQGCTPSSASMVWEDRLNLVRNVALSSDGKSIEFDVPAASIRQGNALIAVKDASGTIMWSWHIWVTDIKLADNWRQVPNAAGSAVYEMLECNLGRIYGGDITQFAPETTTLRLTQKNVPDGLTPLSVDIEVSQESATISTPDCHPFYEWGRKDPMVSGVGRYYNADHQELSSANLPNVPFGTNHKDEIIASIQNPQEFFTGTEAELATIMPFYLNLWNINNAASGTGAVSSRYLKTIYDPCPVGARVPLGNLLLALTGYTGTYDTSAKEVTVTLPGSYGTISLSTLGYRTMEGSWTDGQSFGVYWAAYPGTTRGKARYMTVEATGKMDTKTDAVNLGFAIRPVRD